MSTSGELVARAELLAPVLESRWGQEFCDLLVDNEDAAMGFALAWALNQGWIDPNGGLHEKFCAAEAFLGEVEEGSADDDL